MNRTQLIAKVENRWEEFRAAFTSLTDEQICQAGAFGEWSLKDILGQVEESEKPAQVMQEYIGSLSPDLQKRYGPLTEGALAYFRGGHRADMFAKIPMIGPNTSQNCSPSGKISIERVEIELCSRIQRATVGTPHGCSTT